MPVIRYQCQEYRDGDAALIKTVRDREEFYDVVRILEMWRYLFEQRTYCVLKVRFYFQKHHLDLKKYASFLRHISRNELFLSDLDGLISYNELLDKVSVFTLPEYEDKLVSETLNKVIYFSQASISKATGEVSPPVKDRARICICKAIECPDFEYIQCGFCFTWLHTECAGFAIGDTISTANFRCKSCRKL